MVFKSICTKIYIIKGLSKYFIIDDHFEDNNDKLPRYITSEFIKFNKYHDESDNDMLENLKKDCELVLNNRVKRL